MKTLSELAQQVLDVQDACNLSGVVHSWSEAITNLRELMPTAGTDTINRHPINRLWADKVADLTGTADSYDTVREMATSKSGPVTHCICPECWWEGNDTTLLDLSTMEDGSLSKLTKNDIDQFLGEDGQMPRTCPKCGALVDKNNVEPLKDSMHPQGL